MKKLQYLKLTLLCVILFAGCQTQDEIITQDDLVINETLEQETSDFKDDVFVDGINQTYLEESGMTREELEEMIQKEEPEELINFQKELEKQSNAVSTHESLANRGFDFNRGELAGAIAYLLYDIQQNARKYFSAKVITDDDGDSKLFFGLSRQLLRNAVSKFPELKQYSSKQKINLHSFSLERIDVSGTSMKIEIKGKVRYRKYVRFLWKNRKIIDVSGRANVTLPLYFDTSRHAITSGSVKISNIVIKAGVLTRVINMFSIITQWVARAFGGIKKDINLDISYAFLSKAYMNFRYFSPSHDDKINLVFDLKTSGGFIHDWLRREGIQSQRIIRD